MFFLKKLITPFILPPGLFILLLLISGIVLTFKYRRKMGLFNISIGLILWVLSSAPFANYIIAGLESEFHLPKDIHGDVIVLLGGGSIDDAPDFSGTGIPADKMVGRLVTAVRLQKNLNIPIIITGGKTGDNEIPEAPIVKRFLMDLGVEEDQIFTDELSRDTYENAKHTRDIILANNYEKPILVTSASHMKRSKLSFDKVGVYVTPYPANFKTRSINLLRLLNYLPRARDLAITSEAFHEYLGILYYTLTY